MRKLSRIHQRKSLSQVFLRENWPCQRMASLLKTAGIKSVIEIGPGGGILSRELVDKGFDVLAIEKDQRFAEALQDEMKLREGQLFEVMHGDILAQDLQAWIGRDQKKKAVVGNIPYAISSPILSWALPFLPQIKGLYFLVQLEFARRVAAPHGHKDYGSLSVFCQLRARTHLEYVVKRTCFRPVPKVDSAVISLLPPLQTYPEALLQKAELVCRTAFMQRRKKLSNSLENLIRKEKPKGELDIDLSKRAENLSPQDYLTIARFLFPDLAN